MSCPSDRLHRPADLRVRPVPELGLCLVFTPSRPMLYTLNAPAWLLLELCDGQDRASLEAAFRDAIAEQHPHSSGAPDSGTIIADLEAKGILLRQPSKEHST